MFYHCKNFPQAVTQSLCLLTQQGYSRVLYFTSYFETLNPIKHVFPPDTKKALMEVYRDRAQSCLDSNPASVSKVSNSGQACQFPHLNC